MPDTAGTVATTPEEFTDALQRWLADEVGDPAVAVTGVTRTSAGYSRENWVFEARWHQAGDDRGGRFIARRDPVGSVLETDRRVEGAVLSALVGSDVLAPVVRWLDVTGDRLGRPAVVMDLAEGTCDSFVLNGGRPEAERVALAHDLYDRMADIHRFDWAAAGLGAELADPGAGAALAAADHWEAELRRVQLEPEPELDRIMAWLRAHAPEAQTTTLVHGDFKAGNVLLRDGRVAVVLDWETAHLGDPLEDIGWVTNPLRAPEHRIPGLWERSDLIARWSERTGLSADPEAVRWWNVLANYKLAVIVLTGTHAFVEGRLDRVFQPPVGLQRLMLSTIGA